MNVAGHRLKVSAGIGAVGLMGGCSLIADLSQFDNATIAVDASVRDSSAQDSSMVRETSTVDGAVADDGGDVSVADTGNEVDDDAGASEAGPAGDGSTRYCVVNAGSTSLFCDDFDDGRPVVSGFGGGSGKLGDGGLIGAAQVGTIQSAEFFSPPSALLIVTDTVPPGGYGNWQLVNHLQNHYVVNLLFSLMIADFDPDVQDLSLIRINDNSGQWGISWDLNGGGGAIQEIITPGDGGPASYQNHGPANAPPNGTWISVNIGVDLARSVLFMTTSLGDAGATTAVLSNEPITPPATLQGGSLAITVGVNYLGGPAMPMHIYYDDVQVLAN